MLYEGDGFWALEWETRAGLSALAVFTGGALALLARAASSGLPGGPIRPLLGVCVALAAYWTFLWLSPQLFYTYYGVANPNLPARIVVDPAPPGLEPLVGALSFEGSGLADHARSGLGWLMLLAAATAPRRAARPGPPVDRDRPSVTQD